MVAATSVSVFGSGLCAWPISRWLGPCDEIPSAFHDGIEPSCFGKSRYQHVGRFTSDSSGTVRRAINIIEVAPFPYAESNASAKKLGLLGAIKLIRLDLLWPVSELAP
ncbi:hypothetical protein LX36DRAFT_660400 [Colletotrichum falcatum]|nr:hypothetical protein LX36DRAFT_660400 [Colletotrichum falcatum]